jgi:glycosyltransferase involved in cell wall biosynthesis
MSHSEDAISALLPVKNGQRYLEALLPNILSMLKESDELVVINDGSSDQSQFITEKYQLSDSRIILINTSGIGLVGALNLGIDTARNNWIARFDVDDEYLQTRLDEQRRYLSKDVSVIFSDYRFRSQTGKYLGSVYSAVLPIPMALSLISSQRTAHPSAVINRRLLIKSGGYQTQDYPVEDLALWLRMSQCGEIVSVPLPLVAVRLYPCTSLTE